MKHRIRTGLLAAIGMVILILDTKTAIRGAREGIDLCLKTVIPALLPFFILSVLLTSSLTGLRSRLLRPLGRLLGIPAGSESLFLIGLLGGYPTGAQAVASAWHDGSLTKQDAGRMLGFCSNAGPSFFFGMAAAQFSSVSTAWILWGIQILSAMAVGCILPSKSEHCTKPRKSNVTISAALDRSLKAMARVCGWVIFFRVALAFCNRWFLWLLDAPAQILFNGIMELTIGCTGLPYIESEGLRLIIAAGLLSFGGICVLMQTASVTGSLGLGMYLTGKLLQTTISVILACLAAFLCFGFSVHPLFLWFAVGILLTEIRLIRKVKKRYSNPQPIGV